MSRVSSANCPLSDCTLVVDNAENIRNSNDKALLGLKADAVVVTPSLRKNTHNTKQAGGAAAITVGVEKAPSVRRECVVGGARKVNARTVIVTSTSVDVVSYRPSALDRHVFAKPFTPTAVVMSATPRRNDPYSLCLLSTSYSPEDSFYACYCDVAETVEPEMEVASQMHTPVCPYAGQPAAKATNLGETTRNLLEMFSLVSTPSKSPCSVTPVRSMESSSSPPTSPIRTTSATSAAAAATTSTRVVRKVVSCKVDRTSGRPVPKPKVAV